MPKKPEPEPTVAVPAPVLPPARLSERSVAPEWEHDLELTAERDVRAKPEDSLELEMTSIHARRMAVDADLHDGLDGLDLTTQRKVGSPSELDDIAPPPPIDDREDDDDHDAGETFAIPMRAAAAFMPAPVQPEGFVLPPPNPDAMAFARASKSPVKFAAASQHVIEQPVAQHLHDDLDPNAFADLEPTSLKAPMHTDTEERPTTHISPAERGLLAAMSEGHEASRTVYMNWLERRGEKQRAEFLRVEQTLAAMTPVDIRYEQIQDHLRALAQKISIDWRSRVSRSLIEGCSATACPAYWRALPADADDVRTCAGCGSQVFYCVNVELARGRLQSGQRVALDVTAPRMPHDLEPHCAGCGMQLPLGTRFCPHCGRSTMF
ncbi:MAG: zinc ribbon domain-containing protein [Kofleriaceae bacterium]